MKNGVLKLGNLREFAKIILSTYFDHALSKVLPINLHFAIVLKIATFRSCLGQGGVGHRVCNKNGVGEL